MRRLLEYGPNNNFSYAASEPSVVDYKTKLKKLFEYHMSEVGYQLVSCGITRLDEDAQFVNLEYEEVASKFTLEKNKKKFVITLEKATGNWVFEFISSVSKGNITTKSGRSFHRLIDTLEQYNIECPPVDSVEYNEILEELGANSISEEFKEYENLWEETEALNENFDDGFQKAFEEFKNYLANPENRAKYNSSTSQEQSAIDKPVNNELSKMLDSYDNIELEYDGFEREWYEDHFSHISGHYTTGGTTRYPDFTYEIDATSAYEAIDTVLYQYSSGKIKTSLPSDKYAQEVFKLYTNKKNTKNDAAAEMIAHFEYEYYIIYNLEELVTAFYDEIKETQYKYAMEWAEEYLEGDYDDDGYDYDDYDD